MMASPLGRSPTAQSPLSRDYVYNVDSNKLWIPGKKFGPLTYYYGDIMLLHRDEQFQCKYWRTVTYLPSVTPLQHWLHWHRLHRHYEFREIVGAIYTEYIYRCSLQHWHSLPHWQSVNTGQTGLDAQCNTDIPSLLKYVLFVRLIILINEE